MGIKKLLTVFGFAALSACIPQQFHYEGPPQVHEIANGSGLSFGGSPGTYMNRIHQMAKRGDTVRITSAVCLSACTFHVVLDNVCTSRKTSWGFHEPSWGGVVAPKDKRYFLESVEIYRGTHPYIPGKRRDELADWVKENALGHVITYAYISGADMIDKYGVPECQ